MEAYNLRNSNGSDDLATDPARGTQSADGVMIHVGGSYTRSNGQQRVTGSLGCFGLCGQDEGNAGAKRFINDVVTRREKNRKAGAGTAVNITVEQRQNVDWQWEVDKQGKKQ